MDSSDVLLVALVVLVPAALLWAVFLFRTGRPRVSLGIPQAMRPGEPDEVLEGPRLDRILLWGFAMTAILIVGGAAYWFPERQRQEGFVEKFDEASVERGEIIFQPAETLPDEFDPLEFKKIEKSIALGMGCANCHGGEGGGGLAFPAYVDPITGETFLWQAPPLNNVFQRWDEEIVRFTIERGRPGTPMPAWGTQFGGPMTDQMVDDVIAWLKTLPGNNEAPPDLEGASGEEIFEARCAVCHGPEGQGKEDPTLFDNPFDDTDDEFPKWYPGMALWKGDVEHLTDLEHERTIRNGRRFQFMPPFGEAPAQGIPVPLYPLTDEQIDAVMEYERSL